MGRAGEARLLLPYRSRQAAAVMARRSAAILREGIASSAGLAIKCRNGRSITACARGARRRAREARGRRLADGGRRGHGGLGLRYRMMWREMSDERGDYCGERSRARESDGN